MANYFLGGRESVFFSYSFTFLLSAVIQWNVSDGLPKSKKMIIIHGNLVRGWTNPSEKYARQIGSFPQISGWK